MFYAMPLELGPQSVSSAGFSAPAGFSASAAGFTASSAGFTASSCVGVGSTVLTFAENSSAVIGLENMPKVPVVAAAWPSAEVAAQQSVTVTTLNPFSHAVRIVDSTQQLVSRPHRATVSMPAFLSSASSVVLGKASRPFLPLTITSP